MKINFGSIYALKYDYTRNNPAKTQTDRTYKAKNPQADEFIKTFVDYYKSDNDVSSFDAKKRLYFFNVNNRYDFQIEKLAKKLNVQLEKVNQRNMNGTKIVSVGWQDGYQGEQRGLDDIIIGHEFQKFLEKSKEFKITKI